jgi:hypothetical protein
LVLVAGPNRSVKRLPAAGAGAGGAATGRSTARAAALPPVADFLAAGAFAGVLAGVLLTGFSSPGRDAQGNPAFQHSLPVPVSLSARGL